MALPPGYLYNYNGGDTTLLAAVLAKKTGQTLDDYAREKLFAPLGISDFRMDRHARPRTRAAAASGGSRLRPRDLAKIGQLMTSDGSLEGQAGAAQGLGRGVDHGRTSTASGIYYYGYQWWLGRTLLHPAATDRGSLASAWADSASTSSPTLDLVVTVNAGYYGPPLQGVIPHQIFTRFVLQAVKD